MVKLVDAADSKSASERSVGSSPTLGTKFKIMAVAKLDRLEVSYVQTPITVYVEAE